MAANRCTRCEREVKNYHDFIMVLSANGHIPICLHCYNKEVSEAIGIEFDEVDLQPILLQDADETDHTFHFSVRLVGSELVLRAFEEEYENRSRGYEFSIIGQVEDGIFFLFSKLYNRMCNALSRKHIYHDRTTDTWQITESDIVRGHITHNPDTEDWSPDPMVIVDGKEITWKAFGQMLKPFEGANFKLQIFDQSDEMD